MRCKRFARMGMLAASFVLASSIHSFGQTYHLADQWMIGGQGGWDYLVADGPAHRLYATHNSRVEVVDTMTGKVLGAVTGMKSTHGVALDPDGKTGYISDGAGNAVVLFDRSTFATEATIPAGTNPDGIVYEPVTKTVWAFNGRSHDVSVIDVAVRKVVATVPVGGKPEFPVADGKGNVFVNIEDKSEILKLDAKTHSGLAHWPLGCDSPSGLAYDAAGHRLFSVCDGGKMVVTDSLTGKVLARPAIGDSPDATGYDAQHKVAFSSNGDGTLTVVDASKPSYPVVQTLKTEKGARTMAFDDTTGRVYLVTAKFGPAPAPSAASPRPRPTIEPDSFSVLVVSR